MTWIVSVCCLLYECTVYVNLTIGKKKRVTNIVYVWTLGKTGYILGNTESTNRLNDWLLCTYIIICLLYMQIIMIPCWIITIWGSIYIILLGLAVIHLLVDIIYSLSGNLLLVNFCNKEIIMWMAVMHAMLMIEFCYSSWFYTVFLVPWSS